MALSPYLTKLMTYHEVHQLSRNGFSISYISTLLGLNWRTVKRLLAIEDDRDYEQYLQSCSDKNRVLEPYESFVKGRLELYRDTSTAQMHDWLKEHFTNFPTVSTKTAFNFVTWVRQKYQLPKIETSRLYEMVAETPHGAQAQIDFGVYNLRNTQGSRAKVYFFVMVLSRSRYKYVYFSLEPFTADAAIEAHEKAFCFIMGIPDTLVYDQDRVFMVDENQGDLILTDAFKNYCRDRKFKLHFCRKADPESKGKVENVVKYVKQNFLYNRSFDDIDSLNTEALAWLGRTANSLSHGTTKKRPVEEWEIEKPYLNPFHPLPLPPASGTAYTVRKDNSFSYKSNFYSLPSGTYQGRGTKILLEKRGVGLILYNMQHQEICSHLISTASGEKIINSDHRREKSTVIQELENQFCSALTDPKMGRQLVAAIRHDKPRYIRDQLLLLIQATKAATPAIIGSALRYCCESHISGAADFKSVVAHFQQLENQERIEQYFMPSQTLNPLNGKMPDQALIQPATSSINDYDIF
jgi:transposase